MRQRSVCGLFLAASMALPLAAQMPAGFLDVTTVRVKPGKRAEFDAISKRVAEINRKNKGDYWLAYEVLYGRGPTINFVAQRPSFAGTEQGIKAFEGTLLKALGPAGVQKLWSDWDNTIEMQQSTLRRRRWDLSANAPADNAAYARAVGQARYIRSTTIHVRPDHADDFEALLKQGKEVQERINPNVMFAVSQSGAGEESGIFRISALVKSLAEIDEMKPMSQAMGSSYAEYHKSMLAATASSDTMIGRFVPEISNPPEEIVAVDPKFWRPSPPAPKAAEAKKQ